MKTTAFKYYLRAPYENAELVWEQMFTAHRYRNENVVLERITRADTRSALEADAEFQAVVTELRDAQANLVAEIKKMSAEKVRTGKLCGSPAARAAVSKARLAHKKVFTRFCAVRKVVEIRHMKAMDRIKRDARGRRRDTRRGSGSYWGSYLLVDKAVRQSAAQPIYDKDGSAKDPKFVLWTREGTLGVRFQGDKWQDTPVERLFQENGLLMIDKVDERAWHSAIGVRPERRENQPVQAEPRHSPKGQGRRTLMHTKLHMCVATNKRKPIFASWEMMMHRQIPPGSLIREACVTCNRVGSRTLWALIIIADVPDPVRTAPLGTGTVAINIGWRKLPNGDDRIAVWVGEDGRSGEIRLSKASIASFKRADELRSDRDLLFNRMRGQLVEWLRGRKELPEWILRATMSRHARHVGGKLPSSAQAIAWIACWRSQARLASLVLTWEKNRMEGDEEIFGRRGLKGPDKKPIDNGVGLEGWRYHDKHLWDYQSFQRRKAQNRRREDYRLCAAYLASQYDGCATIKFEKTKVAKKPDEEKFSEDEAAARDEAARANRHIVAPSHLHDAHKQGFESRGKPFAEHDPKLKTRTCHLCGHVDKDGDFAESIMHTCPGCGATWDQDLNHCKNLLDLHKQAPQGTKVKRRRKVTSGDPNESAHARSRRLAAEQDARVAAEDAALAAAEAG